MSPRPAKAVRGRVGEDPATALREHLIETAEALLAQRPVSAITTRDIARAAGVSDGVLYNYFADKHELVVAALVRRYAGLAARYDADLPGPGLATVEENLAAYLRAVLDLVAQTLPIAAGLVTEPKLLHRFIEEIHRQPFGPERVHRPVAEYLRAEQRLGRLGNFDVEAATVLLIGPAITLGFGGLINGVAPADLANQIPPIVSTLVRGLRASE